MATIRFPAAADVLLFAMAFKPALGFIQPPIQLVSGIKRPGREAHRTPPCIVEVKNAWSYAFIHQVHFHGVVLN
jgi:hypothetical protein